MLPRRHFKHHLIHILDVDQSVQKSFVICHLHALVYIHHVHVSCHLQTLVYINHVYQNLMLKVEPMLNH